MYFPRSITSIGRRVPNELEKISIDPLTKDRGALENGR
jgi:hypothetical protein